MVVKIGFRLEGKRQKGFIQPLYSSLLFISIVQWKTHFHDYRIHSGKLQNDETKRNP